MLHNLFLAVIGISAAGGHVQLVKHTYVVNAVNASALIWHS